MCFAFSPDASQQLLYVVDSGPMRVMIFDRSCTGAPDGRCSVRVRAREWLGKTPNDDGVVDVTLDARDFRP